MGFAASQARLIVLTQRKSDLEMRMQQISNSEMMLAMQSEEVANEYSRKLSNRTLRVEDRDGKTVRATSEQVANKGYVIVDKDGNLIYGAAKDGGTISGGSYSSEELEEGIRSGLYIMYKASEYYAANGNSDDENAARVLPDSAPGGIFTGLYTEDDAQAEAEYNSKMAGIHAKEKRLQTEMVQVQSQQKACETEMESVKKLIEKNTEQIFKYYN